MNEDRLSGHFSRAESLLLVNERGEKISRHVNPALDGGCSAKRDLLDLLVRQDVGRVVVRNIGRQMLGKLLDRGITVFKIQAGQVTLGDLVDPRTTVLSPLTDPDQGRVSLNHEAKRAEGGCGCGRHDHGHDGCHDHEAGHERERCCRRGHAHADSHPYGHGGHGRCCRRNGHQDA